MKTFLKFLLIVLIWALIAAGCIGLAVLFDEELIFGYTLFAVIFGLWYGVKLIIWLIKRWRAKQQVKRLINVDETQNTSTMELFWKNITGRSDFDKHIIEVVKFLRNNGLNKSKDPLNSVPWVLHLGHNERSKKWLKTESVERPQIYNGLLNEHDFVEWHPLNDQLVLDVSPQLLPNNNAISTDCVEFFDGISKLKRERVIDAIVVSLDIHQLTDEEALKSQLKSYRQFFELLRSNCGIDAPVNMVLHGIEEQPGVHTWLDALPDHQLAQVLGFRNAQSKTPEALISDSFEHLSQIIRQSNFGNIKESNYDSALAVLPKTLTELNQNLTPTLSSLFNANKFQSAPIFAGLYFVLQKQEQTIFANQLLENPWFVWRNSIIIEKKTNHFSPRKLAWYGITFTFAIVMWAIHQADNETIHGHYNTYSNALDDEPSLSGQVNNLTALSELISNLDNTSLNYWLPKSSDPLNVALLQTRFVNKLHEDVLSPIDEGFDARIKSSDTDAVRDNDTTVDYINIMIRRINFLQAALNGASANDLSAMPLPYDSDYLYNFPEEMLANINQLYIDSIFTLIESEQESTIKASLTKQKSQLKELLIASGGDLDWLVDWVNSNRAASDITLKKYWSFATGDMPDIQVDRAYTVEGKAIIDQFLAELTSALQDKELVDSWLPEFNERYAQSYFDAWGRLMVNFEEGANALNSREEWLGTINNLTTSRSHYFSLLNDAEFHLSPIGEIAESPEWFEFLVYYQDMLALGQDEVQDNAKKNKVLTKLALKFIGATGAFGKAIAGSGKSALKTKKKLDKASGPGPGASERELVLQDAADELDNYKRAIADVVYNVERRKFAFENVNSLFANPDNPGGAGTALGNALGSVIKLQGMIGKSTTSNQAFWSIYTGPVELMKAFMLRESACYLDERWEKDFLTDLDGVPDYKMADFVYGETGVLWTYLETNLANFVERKAGAGYRGTRFDGEKIPFTPDFMMFLTQSRDQKSVQQFGEFKLAIETLPTNVDADALLYVSQTDLTIQCGTEQFHIINKNFPIENILTWNQSCGPTQLTFDIAGRKLVKDYPGNEGFLHFLRDFRTGTHDFLIEEFPEQYYAMNEFKISTVNANININGVEQMIKTLSRKPMAVPRRIAQCPN